MFFKLGCLFPVLKTLTSIMRLSSPSLAYHPLRRTDVNVLNDKTMPSNDMLCIWYLTFVCQPQFSADNKFLDISHIFAPLSLSLACHRHSAKSDKPFYRSGARFPCAIGILENRNPAHLTKCYPEIDRKFRIHALRIEAEPF